MRRGEIYHSGFLKPDGTLDPRAHSFTNRPVNTDGEFVDNHKVWTIHSVAYDNTVQCRPFRRWSATSSAFRRTPRARYT